MVSPCQAFELAGGPGRAAGSHAGRLKAEVSKAILFPTFEQMALYASQHPHLSFAAAMEQFCRQVRLQAGWHHAQQVSVRQIRQTLSEWLIMKTWLKVRGPAAPLALCK